MTQEQSPVFPPLELKSPGQRLRWHRLRLGLSQEALAEALEVSARSIRRWEQDQAIPQEVARQRLCQQFGIDQGQLLGALPIEEAPAVSTPFWHIPFHHNPFFTGRETILEQLHSSLLTTRNVVLRQSSALSGLGGIGKTQTAIEYAYRYASEYVAVFWISAETVESILSSFATIARLLKLPDKEEHDQSRMVTAVTFWLTCHHPWLLIFDNVEDLELVKRFLPSTRHGFLLLTTRRQAPGLTDQCLELEQMMPEEGLRFLLHRARRLDPMTPLCQLVATEVVAAKEIVAAMDGLPLALDQAGAYLEATRCSLSDYLRLFQSAQHRLLAERDTHADHPLSVSRTFTLIFEQLEQSAPAAIEVLTVCAFLASEAIPEEFFQEGAAQLGPTFEALMADPLHYQATFKALLSSSLLQRHVDSHTLTIHRLVQAVLKGRLSEEAQRMRAEQVIQAMARLFPSEDTYDDYWQCCERLVPHALVCLSSGEQWDEDKARRMTLTNHVASYLSKRARFAEAEALYRQSLQIGEYALGTEEPLVAEALQRLAYLYGLQGRYSEAEPLFQRALYAREQALGTEHPLVAEVRSWLAVLYRHQGKYAEAEVLFLQALRIQEHALGQEHPLVVQTLFGLAALYRHQGRYTEAESLYERALRIGEQVFGLNHHRVAALLNNLADLYLEWGKYEQIEPLFQRALQIWEQTLGPEHPYQANSLEGLAALYTAQGKNEQAEQFFQRALRIRERALGSEHPEVAYLLHRLAALYAAQGKDEQAEQLYLRALRIREQVVGQDHPDIAESFHGLATLYAKRGKSEQAESLYLRALALRQQHLGHEHPIVAESLRALARFYQEMPSHENRL